ncbi:FAD binding domain-containing protein [Euzebya tangerina]|uniref:FAD binding domain-containing protein n=1 Tax=Euzebya tangerina TaxID=591198 RepID=UPI000E30F165|nr:xanthine dehydrogenase family protein subunit M [Euzebya tangerina]
MTIARPTTLDQALDALQDMPDAHLLAGGTDLMVEVNHGQRRPRRIVALRRVAELQGVDSTDDGIDLGALTTYRQVETDLAADAPGLAMASRTVGSPQIRNAGTIGGNIGTASPAGDALPWLIAMDAEVELAGPEGTRRLPLAEFLVGVKQTAIAAGEIVTRVHVPDIQGPQHVAKIGPRSAMAISVASLALVLDTAGRRVRAALGSVGPTPIRPTAAEDAISQAIDWDALSCTADDVDSFGQAVARAAAPITDHRSTAEYRRHAVGVLATRTLTRCLFT